MEIYECDVLYRPEDLHLAFLPEGPIDMGGGQFSWVAIQHGADTTHGSLNVFDLSARTNKNYPLTGRPGFAFPTADAGTFVIGQEHELGLFSVQSGDWTVLNTNVDANVSGTTINDGVECAAGLIFGCKDLQFKEQKAGLYFWRKRDRKLFPLRSDQICSNGKVILDEGDRVKFLDIDTPTRVVVEYDLDIETGSLGEPRQVLDLHRFDDFPDGMVLTPDGQSVIIAFYNPNDAAHGETRQFRLSDGQVEAVWKTPGSPQVTCPLLIEHDGVVQIVLTTAVEHMPAEKQARYPNAGCLFIGETQF